MVSRAIETVGPDKVKAVSAQLGKDNLEVFRAGASAGLYKVQAVWSTPLAKTMNSLGFRSIEVSSVRVSYG